MPAVAAVATPRAPARALRMLVLAVALPLVGVLAGCKVDTVNPIVPTAQAQPDPGLYGLWRYREKDELTYVHIGPDFALGEAQAGGPMRIVIVDHKANGLTEEDYRAYGARLGGRRYLAVEQTQDGRREGYLVVRYVLVDRATLRFSRMKEEALKAAIGAGRIAGTTRGEGVSAQTAITADSADVAAFLAAAGDDLFETAVVLRRVPAR